MGVVKLFSHLPFPLLYFFSDVLNFFLFNIFKYRKKIIEGNLKNSFPEKSKAEIKTISRKFQRNFCDLILESVKCFSISGKALKQKVTYLNPEVFSEYYKLKRNVLLVCPHYTNWELIGIGLGLLPVDTFHILYKPVKNKVVNNYLLKSREQFGLKLLPAKSIKTELPEIINDGEWHCFAFVADQMPKPTSAIWFDFLNQKTGFFRGPAIYSKKYNLPLIYAEMNQVKRGHYELFLKPICDDPSKFSQEELTKMHVKEMEAQIKAIPENWLWSHKRWKHNYEDYISETTIEKA